MSSSDLRPIESSSKGGNLPVKLIIRSRETRLKPRIGARVLALVETGVGMVMLAEPVPVLLPFFLAGDATRS